MRARGYFITGTDTDCGKTEVSLALMWGLQANGLSVNAMKPVASGAESTPAGLRNGDALRLQAQSSTGPESEYRLINPFAFEPPIAPHIAAAEAPSPIDLETIGQCAKRLSARADLLLVEGVGGWLVPLGERLMLSDLARSLDLPVILVVGMKLGCLNHALLSVESISTSGCRLVGWVANQIDPEMLEQERNLESLRSRIPAPLLGRIPHLSTPSAESLAGYLDLSLLSAQTD